jgi:8-oxo-dGTP diphosphatase
MWKVWQAHARRATSGWRGARRDVLSFFEEKLNCLIRVVAAIIEHRGRLLICQRRACDVFGLKWEFPGGKIKRGETPRAALARELREELGVAAAIGREVSRTHHRYADMATAVDITFFAATRPFPAPQNIVFERIVWAWPSDLLRYDFLAADRAFIARLVRGEFVTPVRKQP